MDPFDSSFMKFIYINNVDGYDDLAIDLSSVSIEDTIQYWSDGPDDQLSVAY